MEAASLERTMAMLLLASASLALLAQFMRLLSMRTKVWVTIGRAWADLRPMLQGLDRGELGPAVCEKLLERKVQLFRCLLPACGLVMALSQVLVFAKSLRGAGRHQTLVQDIVLVLSQGACTFAALRPDFVSVRSLDAFYMVLSLATSVYISPMACAPSLLGHALLVTNAAMAVLNVGRCGVQQRRLPVYLLCNALFAVSASSALAMHGDGLFLNKWSAVRWQLLLLFGVWLGPQLLEAAISASLQQTLRLEEVRELHTALEALLHSFCECTVELDGDGRLVGGARELGSFLMKGDLSYNLTGMLLTDLVTEAEDKARLQERLREPRMQRLGLADCVPVSMKDGCGNSLRLELFWFHFRRMDGKQHSMVGVRELSDLQASTAQPCESTLLDGTLVMEDGLATLDGSSVTSDEPGAVILVVDTLEAGFPIKGQAPGFIANMGRLPLGEPLARYLKKPQPFMAWVQREVLREQPGSCGVLLVLPWGQCRANCRVLLKTSSGSEAEDSCLQEVGLLFTHVEFVVRDKPWRFRGTPHSASAEAHLVSI